MLDVQTLGHKAPSISLTEYATDLARRGVHIFPGGSGTFWAGYLFGSMRRFPMFYLTPPTSNEVRQVLWRGPATVASYLLNPDERHPANVWLHICADQTYGLEKLTYTMRKNVRRGLGELKIEPVTVPQVLTHGYRAFCDTRRKHGRSDATPEAFRQHFSTQLSWPEIVFLGAWKDNHLAAFLSIIEVEDWAEFYEIFSMDALLQYRPNDTLYYSALSHYLRERKFRLVYTGMSSLQVTRNDGGLYRFKTKVGFEAKAAHRVFMPHPLLRLFANRLTLWGVKTALRFKPENNYLKTASGVLASMSGDTSRLEVAARSPSNQ